MGLALLPAPAWAQAGIDEPDEDPPLERYRPERELEPGELPGGGDKNRVHLPESRGLEVRCRRAAEAEAAGEWTVAVRAYIEIMRDEREPDEGIQHLVKLGPERYTSYVRYARERVLSMPEAGRRAFRAVADAEARALYDAAVRRGDERTLDLLWRTFPAASAADEALERLGDQALERGDLDLAALRYERAATIAGGDLDPLRLEAKRARALRKSPLRPGSGRTSADPPSAGPPATGLRAGAPLRWPIVGGDNAHAAALPGLAALAPAPRIAFALPPSRGAASWGMRSPRLPRLEGAYPGRDDVFPETIPTADQGRVVFTTANAIVCYDLLAATGTEARRWYQGLWTGQDRNPNGFYSATIERGRVFAPFIRRVSRPEYYRGIPIKEEIAYRRLVAFDLATGKRLWDHAESADPFLRHPDVSVALPPVVKDGVVYAGAVIHEGTLKCYLLACDAATGRLLWKRYVGGGQVELTMFGEHAIEPLAMQPCENAGTVYHCTGFGTLAAVSALTGELEWLATYETIPVEAARTYYAVERELPWRSAGPPVHADGTVVLAPIDALKAFAFDAATGELRWAVERGSLRRLLGVDRGRAVFQGDRLHAYDLRTGKLAVSFPKAVDAMGFGEEEAGRGLLCGGVALIPQASRIARIDLGTGERLADLPLPGGIKETGTLLYLGRELVTVNPQRASVFQVGGPATGPADAPGPAGTR